MELFWIMIIGTVGIVVILLVAILPFPELPFGIAHDMKEANSPTGKEAVTTILDNDDGCLFEVDGVRHITNLGVFVEDSCPYLTGEKVVAYETKGGWWNIKGLEKDLK